MELQTYFKKTTTHFVPVHEIYDALPSNIGKCLSITHDDENEFIHITMPPQTDVLGTLTGCTVTVTVPYEAIAVHGQAALDLSLMSCAETMSDGMNLHTSSSVLKTIRKNLETTRHTETNLISRNTQYPIKYVNSIRDFIHSKYTNKSFEPNKKTKETFALECLAKWRSANNQLHKRHVPTYQEEIQSLFGTGMLRSTAPDAGVVKKIKIANAQESDIRAMLYNLEQHPIFHGQPKQSTHSTFIAKPNMPPGGKKKSQRHPMPEIGRQGSADEVNFTHKKPQDNELPNPLKIEKSRSVLKIGADILPFHIQGPDSICETTKHTSRKDYIAYVESYRMCITRSQKPVFQCSKKVEGRGLDLGSALTVTKVISIGHTTTNYSEEEAAKIDTSIFLRKQVAQAKRTQLLSKTGPMWSRILPLVVTFVLTLIENIINRPRDGERVIYDIAKLLDWGHLRMNELINFIIDCLALHIKIAPSSKTDNSLRLILSISMAKSDKVPNLTKFGNKELDEFFVSFIRS
jgi:hypothetical protein